MYFWKGWRYMLAKHLLSQVLGKEGSKLKIIPFSMTVYTAANLPNLLSQPSAILNLFYRWANLDLEAQGDREQADTGAGSRWGQTEGVSTQPKSGPLLVWRGKGKAGMTKTPSSFQPGEAVVPHVRKERQVPTLSSKGQGGPEFLLRPLQWCSLCLGIVGSLLPQLSCYLHLSLDLKSLIISKRQSEEMV